MIDNIKSLISGYANLYHRTRPFPDEFEYELFNRAFLGEPLSRFPRYHFLERFAGDPRLAFIWLSYCTKLKYPIAIIPICSLEHKIEIYKRDGEALIIWDEMFFRRISDLIRCGTIEDDEAAK